VSGIVSTAEVLALTGQTVTDDRITQAQGIISIKCGRDLSDALVFSGTGLAVLVPFARDQRLLKSAVAYQAAWMNAHPDTFLAADITQMTADGTSAVYKETGLYLAPLARVCLRRLSWQRTRSIHVDRAPASAPRDLRGDTVFPTSRELLEVEEDRQGAMWGWIPL
jgi:hypothetical protein